MDWYGKARSERSANERRARQRRNVDSTHAISEAGWLTRSQSPKDERNSSNERDGLDFLLVSLEAAEDELLSGNCRRKGGRREGSARGSSRRGLRGWRRREIRMRRERGEAGRDEDGRREGVGGRDGRGIVKSRVMSILEYEEEEEVRKRAEEGREHPPCHFGILPCLCLLLSTDPLLSSRFSSRIYERRDKSSSVPRDWS